MINANELRIGNWILFNGNPSEINYNDFGYFKRNGIQNYEPIPLTPEILESCGFEGEVWKDFKLPVLCEGQEITLTMCASKNSWALCMKGYSDQGADEFEIANIFKDLKKENYPNGIGITHKENFMVLKNIKHLHQLQNLYFALTGTELKINLNVEIV